MFRSSLLYRFLAAAALASALACSRSMVSSTPYRTLPPKSSPSLVAIYTDVRPDRGYEELGVIDAMALGLTTQSDYGKLIVAARERAAEMGADAIIVTRRPIESTTTTGNVHRKKNHTGGGYVESTSTSETPRISVVAIVWKPDQE